MIKTPRSDSVRTPADTVSSQVLDDDAAMLAQIDEDAALHAAAHSAAEASSGERVLSEQCQQHIDASIDAVLKSTAAAHAKANSSNLPGRMERFCWKR